MPNDRLRSTLRANNYSVEKLAEETGVAAKTVQRWVTQEDRTPHRNTAHRVAKLLGVPLEWLWPELEEKLGPTSSSEVVTFYPHRSDTPRHVWLDLLIGSRENIDLFANASLFLPEENPEVISIIRHKAEQGTAIRILMGDPESDAAKLRGYEERLDIPGRIRMALAYYRPLIEVKEIEFRLQATALYNSIFRFDDQMLVNQHIYGTYGYLAPILHLRKIQGADLFDTYMKSFERIWADESYPYDA